MITRRLSEDALLEVKGQMAIVEAIASESVTALFRPRPVANAKTSKIDLRIKDIDSSDGKDADRHIQLTVTDRRKRETWSITLRLQDLEMLLAKIFSRIKDFRSLQICAAGEVSKYKFYKEPIPFRPKRQAFREFLAHLHTSVIRASQSLPQPITVRRLFFPPDRAYATSLQTEAIDLIALLGPSLRQLRLCSNHFSDYPQMAGGNGADCDKFHRLFELLKTCTGMEKLKIAGICGCWPVLQDCLRSLPNLRHFELTGLHLWYIGTSPSATWLRDCFQLNGNLKHLAISYKILSDLLTDPSAAVILGRLATLGINFDFLYKTELNGFFHRQWPGNQQLPITANMRLGDVLPALSENGHLLMELNCSVLAFFGDLDEQTNWCLLPCLVVLELAARTEKRISVAFLYCETTQEIVQQLMQVHSTLSVEAVDNGQIIRYGTATLAFKN